MSVDDYNKSIRENNEGNQPVEPYQRISQAVFEAWMKDICDENPLIDLRFGWRMESLEEKVHGVDALFTEIKSDEKHVFKAKYVIGCDGASSRTRRCLNTSLEGRPL
jgi:FAD-dependent monooxygenase